MKMGRGSVFHVMIRWRQGRGTCEEPRAVQNRRREEENGEVKPRRGPGFASVCGSGEGVWALFEGEWAASSGFMQRINAIRLASNLDHFWRRVLRPLLQLCSSVRLHCCLHFLSNCCLFLFKTLEKK